MMMMKISLLGPFLLLFLYSRNPGLGSVVTRTYHYSDSYYTWQEAQTHCRTHFSDLAIYYEDSDTEGTDLTPYNAWIGMRKVPYDEDQYWWRWTSSSGSYYANWAEHHPHSSSSCAYVRYGEKKVYGTSCEPKYFFYCHDKKWNHFEHKFIPQARNWSDARHYCTELPGWDDLATFKNWWEFDDDVVEQDFPVWIGLHREGKTLKWSSRLSDYRKWDSGEPNDAHDCVSLSSKHKKMATKDCSARFPFVCFKDNLLLVKENKTWEEALEHCSDLGYQLVSVQPGDDYTYMSTVVQEAVTVEVWVGLRFLAGFWLWVNGMSVAYPNLPTCPVDAERCGILSKNDTGGVENRDCLEKKNFLCYL